MEHYKVIRPKCLPTRMPIGATAIAYLLMDHWHAAGWVKGVVWTCIGLIWAVFIAAIFLEDYEEPIWKERAK